ncbi:MAG: HAD-IIB family hydrolase [Bacteroidales bacterium]|jgi:HAD superfamily hydrolase (TIGR01484 family)|nr:HAD-IIB family hydrolase [Bacteroidales bacterium]
MFVSDYDGTLAGNDSRVSSETIDELVRIGNLGIIRAVATGRSLFSIEKVVDKDFPVDYLICSSGIGIYDWRKKELLHKSEIDYIQTKNIYDFLVENNYDFMVQLPVPNNHFFHHFYSGKNLNKDFITRVRHYKNNGLEPIIKCPDTASQFVIICNKEQDHYNTIKKQFGELNIVKATSPIDGKSIWIEILPGKISKASGIEFIRKKINILKKDIVIVGNDYYDLDMLNYADVKNSYIVENSPDDIKFNYNIIDSNENNGVAKLLKKLY